MKKLIFLFFLFLSSNVFCQSIEISGGILINNYFDKIDYFTTTERYYKSRNGYSLKLCNTSLIKSKYKFRYSISYSKYRGYAGLSVPTIGWGVNGIYEISALSIGLYPLNFKLLNTINFSFGIEFPTPIKAHFNGNSYNINTYNGGIRPINANIENEIANFSIGLSGYVSYSLKISKKIFITSNLYFYSGLKEEFNALHFMFDLFSRRGGFRLGLKRVF